MTRLICTIVCCLAAAEAAAAGTPLASPRCFVPRYDLTKEITASLTHGATIGPVMAVRSRDYAKVYFASAVLRPAKTFHGQVATWATNKNGYGLLYAADGFAQQFSAAPRKSGVSFTDDGGSEARACAKQMNAFTP